MKDECLICGVPLVGCPFIGRDFDDNWSLPDPTGQAIKFLSR